MTQSARHAHCTKLMYLCLLQVLLVSYIQVYIDSISSIKHCLYTATLQHSINMPAPRLTPSLTAFRARAVAARSVARPACKYNPNSPVDSVREIEAYKTPCTVTFSRNAGTSASPDPKSPKTSPDSDSPQEQGVKSSRANDDPSNVEQGGSTAKPVSGQGDSVGASEEGGDPAKR